MPATQKICCACNADVAGKKRVKDPQGNYYCQACYDARIQQKQPVSAAVAAGAALLDDELADNGEIGLAEEIAPAAAPAQEEMFGCADCKTLVPKRQIRNDDGDFVCVPCFTKRRRGAARPATAMPKRRADVEDDEPRAPSFGDSLLGGLALTAASIVALFALTFGLQFVLPLPLANDTGKTLADASSAFGVALLYSFYHIAFATIIWLGAFIAVKLTANPSTFGATLWKCFATCAAVTFFFRITDQWFLGRVFGILPAIFFGIRYSSVAAGVANLLQLDAIPRRIAVFVGMLLTELVGFLFYIVMGILIAANVIHSVRNPDEDAKLKQFQHEFLDRLRQQGVQFPPETPPGTKQPTSAPAPTPQQNEQ